jgi:hypothetical protein
VQGVNGRENQFEIKINFWFGKLKRSASKCTANLNDLLNEPNAANQ